MLHKRSFKQLCATTTAYRLVGCGPLEYVLSLRIWCDQKGDSVAKQIPEDDLAAIENALRRHTDGATLQQIADTLKTSLPAEPSNIGLNISWTRSALS